MKATIITFCLLGAIYANPILHNVTSVSNESNSTEIVSVSQLAENNTSELQSSEEDTSNQSSESESLESDSTSEDKTSEESDSQSDEDDDMDSVPETEDNSMGSEENVRKSWVRVISNVAKVLSAEDNNSTEVKGQDEDLSNELTTSSNVTAQSSSNLPLLDNTKGSDSNSADTTEMVSVTDATSDSSESISSESPEASDSSDSSDASQSSEDSNTSDSAELEQVRAKDCVNGTQSCESEEQFFQNIGDDAHSSVDNFMVPDEEERELLLRR